MGNITTSNLEDFGYRELKILGELLSAMSEQGLPSDFYNNEVVPMFNISSGNVFLTNSDYQVAMLNNGKLERWYYLSYAGTEGFVNELYQDFLDGEINENDLEELADILEGNGMTKECNKVRAFIER